MSKYIRVTHTYLVPMPDDLPNNDPQMESAMNAGVSMMENHILKLFNNPDKIQNLSSTWGLISDEEQKKWQARGGFDFERGEVSYTRGRAPRRLTEHDPIAKHAIEHDLDEGISFTRDVMGQRPNAPHPWDQGLWIFPEGHRLRSLEEAARAKYDRVKVSSPDFAEGLKQGMLDGSLPPQVVEGDYE